MKVLGYIVGGIVGLFILMMIIGSNVSPEKAALYQKEDRINETCDKMMSDSAPGSDRRMTRQVCDDMKARVQAEKKQ